MLCSLAPASHLSIPSMGTAAALTVRSKAGRKRGRRQLCLFHRRGRPGREEPAIPAVLGSASSAPAFAWRHLAKRHRGVQLSAQRGYGAFLAASPLPPPQPLTCMQPLRPWRPAGDPGTSSYLELRAGKRGGRGRRRRGEEGRWQDAGDCPGCGAAGVRAPLTTAASGGRATEGGREGEREGGRSGGGIEGGKEGGRYASRWERCTAPFKGAETSFLRGRRSRLPATPKPAAAVLPPLWPPAAAGLRRRPAKQKRSRPSSPRRPRGPSSPGGEFLGR